MKLILRILLVFLTCILLLSLHPNQVSASDYQITAFSSHITINQDTSLQVTETISVNFPILKHGIFRIIPVTYSARGKTIQAHLIDVSITDAAGTSLPFERSRIGQSIKLKIGDPERTLIGPYIYHISYRIADVLQIYDGQPELYWNVTGSEWDTNIPGAQAIVDSPHAPIIQTDCFAGLLGSSSQQCTHRSSPHQATFKSLIPVGQGQDFTIVVGLSSDHQLHFPGPIARLTKLLFDNIGYLLALIPAILMFWLWYRYGRDRTYQGDSIYYQPADTKTKSVSPWERHYLPMVYSPIKGLTPAQIGTILDEQVDLHDIVAEILELARLKQISIHKLEIKKKFFGSETDYLLIKNSQASSPLRDYQQFLLEKLFTDKATAKALKRYTDLDQKHQAALKPYLKSVKDQGFVFISSLKNIFYTHLDEFKEKLYADMESSGFFDRNPQKTRIKWLGFFILIDFGTLALLSFWANQMYNFYPLIIAGVFSLLGLALAWVMPRRTPTGHALFRQIQGLRYFIAKGQWRQEIAEKHLFLEETLPLAISLGVVKKLTADMAELEIQPPSYLHGFTVAHLTSDLSTFQSHTASMVSSAPSSSGRSSWSGGSGFSGGSSGGGFGGGGGGSW